LAKVFYNFNGAAFALAAAWLMPAADVSAQSSTSSPSVVELFTSQGCSSCPPADKLLGELATKPGIIAMSFPVTYWDYLGWKDTLARPENTARQRGYAAKAAEGEVYTPQVFVNGLKGCVGSNRSDIEAAVHSTGSALQKSIVAVAVRRDGKKLLIEAGAAPEGSKLRNAKVWVASVLRNADVPIGGGENAGRKVTYTNVVHSLIEAGDWEGAAASYSVPVDGSKLQDGDMFVVFLQAEHLGAIVGAARISG